MHFEPFSRNALCDAFSAGTPCSESHHTPYSVRPGRRILTYLHMKAWQAGSQAVHEGQPPATRDHRVASLTVIAAQSLTHQP